MKVKVGHREYSTIYNERRQSWYISINGRETIYDQDNVWVEFSTEEAAEEYLKDLLNINKWD